MDKMERVISGGHRDKTGKLHPPVTRSSALRNRIENRKSKLREAIKPKSSADEGEYGYEGDMAMSQLRSIMRNCQQMLDALDEKTDLPEWVQSKITLAKDYIETSANYLMSELEESYDGPERRKPENADRRAVVAARMAHQKRQKGKRVDEGLMSGALKVAGKVFNAPAYSWAGEKLEAKEKAKKVAALKAMRAAKKTQPKEVSKPNKPAPKKVTKPQMGHRANVERIRGPRDTIGEAAVENAKTKKVLDKYKGIRNRVNTKPELAVSIRNTSPTIMGNIPGHEGPKPNANF